MKLRRSSDNFGLIFHFMIALMIRDSGVRLVSLFLFYGTHEQLKSSSFIFLLSRLFGYEYPPSFLPFDVLLFNALFFA